MAAKKKDPKPKGIIMYRPRRQTIKLPPAVLGYNHLVDPDVYEGKKKYKANFHYKEEAWDKVEETIQAQADKCVPGFQKDAEKCYAEAEEAGKPENMWVPESYEVSIADWLADKRKEVKSEKAPQQDDFLPLTCPFKEGTDKKTGEPWTLKMKAWDKNGKLLDISKLNPWSGTICIPIVEVGIFANSLFPEPTPTLKLVGIQILKLVRGGGGGDIGAVNNDDLDAWEGEDINEFDDLSAFAGVGLDDDEDDNDDGDDTEENPL